MIICNKNNLDKLLQTQMEKYINDHYDELCDLYINDTESETFFHYLIKYFKNKNPSYPVLADSGFGYFIY